jgi:hypothetical protein
LRGRRELILADVQVGIAGAPDIAISSVFFRDVRRTKLANMAA